MTRPLLPEAALASGAGIPAPLQAQLGEVPSVRTRRSAVLHRLLAVADVTAGATAAVVTSMFLGLGTSEALVVAGLCATLVPTLAFLCGLYATEDLRSWATGIPDVKGLLFTVLALSWLLYGAAAFLGVESAAHVALVASALALVLVAGARAGARAVAHRCERLTERTVIVGSGLVAGQVVHNLQGHRELGLVPVGIVDDPVHHPDYEDGSNLPHFGPIDELSGILRRHAIDRVIIAFTRASHHQLLDAIRACRDNRVPVHVVPRLFEFLDGARALDHVGGLPILSLGVPRLTKGSHTVKRILDMTVSALLLLGLAPLLLAIALAIRVDSRGPVLFRQMRGGRDSTTFDLLKFRSMHEGADERKEQLRQHNDVHDGVMFKIRSDPRVTRVGRVLRRFSFDEVPQLWNVLRGDMSLVGPRPLVLPEAEFLGESWHLRRRDLRPGMTGPWQIYGRSDIPFQDMLRFDYQYVAGWSLGRDIEILLATVPAVLSGRGAY